MTYDEAMAKLSAGMAPIRRFSEMLDEYDHAWTTTTLGEFICKDEGFQKFINGARVPPMQAVVFKFPQEGKYPAKNKKRRK